MLFTNRSLDYLGQDMSNLYDAQTENLKHFNLHLNNFVHKVFTNNGLSQLLFEQTGPVYHTVLYKILTDFARENLYVA